MTRSASIAAATAVLCGGLAAGAASAAAAPAPGKRTYVVLYDQGASAAKARSAIRAAGGQIVRENRAVGLATVVGGAKRFAARVGARPAIAGVAENRAIGVSRERLHRRRAVERGVGVPGQAGGRGGGHARAAELAAVGHADDRRHPGRLLRRPDGQPRRARGRHRHRHRRRPSGPRRQRRHDAEPQLHGRRPARRRPLRRGPRRLVRRPGDGRRGRARHPRRGHHRRRRRTGWASPASRPDVGLVNLRAGQDSGYFFLQPTVDAITYAAERGIDVVNMSFYVDPWLYNCRANPADSPAEQAQQATIIDAATARRRPTPARTASR